MYDSVAKSSHVEIEAILKLVSDTEALKESFHMEAKFKADSYWDEWKEENKKISSLGHTVGSANYVSTGRLAPRVYSPPNTHRVYLEWWDFKKSPLRRIVRSHGVRIKPTKKGYSWISVSRNANPWEKRFFDKYEPQFNRLRILINALCDHINHLKKIHKNLEKNIIKVIEEEVQHGQ